MPKFVHELTAKEILADAKVRTRLEDKFYRERARKVIFPHDGSMDSRVAKRKKSRPKSKDQKQ